MSDPTPAADTPTDPTPATATPPSTGDKGKEPEKPPAVTFTAEQQAEINRLMGAARKEGRDAADEAARKKAEKDRADKDAADAEARGEFEKVKGTMQQSIDSLTGERDALKAQVDSYVALVAPIVADRLAALKAADAEVARGFPADADPLAQLAWLDDPRTKALLAKQAERADALSSWRNTPKPNGDPTGQNDEQARRAMSRMYR